MLEMHTFLTEHMSFYDVEFYNAGSGGTVSLMSEEDLEEWESTGILSGTPTNTKVLKEYPSLADEESADSVVWRHAPGIATDPLQLPLSEEEIRELLGTNAPDAMTNAGRP